MVNEFDQLSKDLTGLISKNGLGVERFEIFPELLLVGVVVLLLG